MLLEYLLIIILKLSQQQLIPCWVLSKIRKYLQCYREISIKIVEIMSGLDGSFCGLALILEPSGYFLKESLIF